VFASVISLGIGFVFESSSHPLHWWWTVLTGWICFLTLLMVIRFVSGDWKSKRMLEKA